MKRLPPVPCHDEVPALQFPVTDTFPATHWIDPIKILMNKTFVGFGFGPIQSALFLWEAQRSGSFGRFVVSEVDAALVAAVRRNGGQCAINVARRDRVDAVVLNDIELLNPRVAADREAIVTAIRESDEMATALPSVNVYAAGDGASVISLLRDGLAARGEPHATVIYTAENNNHAAEMLRSHLDAAAAPHLDSVQVLNTVIGKMSGVITDAETITRLKLQTLTPDMPRAILVEEFNRILISQVTLPGYRRGIDVFVEKHDLLPFEEAKLFGHNAIHALIAYLADLRDLTTIGEAGADEEIMRIARRAFLDESGAAIVARYGHTGDALFTPDGYAIYADDLLQRMVNPNLNDLVERVGRDQTRKLGYDDRLFGTMRLTLDAGVEPANLALGAAAGVVSLLQRSGDEQRHQEELDCDRLRTILLDVWQGRSDRHRETLLQLTCDALDKLRSRPWT